MFLDIITCLIVAFGVYQGFSRGLIKTVFASFSLLIGIVAALKLSDVVITILQNAFTTNPAIMFVIGFVLTFIIVMALIRFVGTRIEKLMESMHIGGVNKLLGGALLGLFYAVLISYGVFLMDKVELITDEVKTASFTYPYLEPLPRATQGIGEALKPLFTDFWDKLMVTMDAIKEKGDSLQEG